MSISLINEESESMSSSLNSVRLPDETDRPVKQISVRPARPTSHIVNHAALRYAFQVSGSGSGAVQCPLSRRVNGEAELDVHAQVRR